MGELISKIQPNSPINHHNALHIFLSHKPVLIVLHQIKFGWNQATQNKFLQRNTTEIVSLTTNTQIVQQPATTIVLRTPQLPSEIVRCETETSLSFYFYYVIIIFQFPKTTSTLVYPTKSSCLPYSRAVEPESKQFWIAGAGSKKI